MGNVANVWTTLPTGTDYQAFCYDEQNRLTWASSASGTVPCGSGGGGTWTAGSLSSASYTNTYTYDTLNRLTSGPLGNYGYGDPAHLDAATAIGEPQAQCPSWGCTPTYSASYDAAGDMTCRAPTSSTTCAGTQTGAQLSYDNERRLASWQNQPTTPTSSTSNLYDGEGNRVEQTVTNGAATTTITYVGELEELSTTAGVTTTTTSYYVGGQRIAQAVNGGAFSYLGSDGLGSAQVALDGSGNAQASVLYDPYGNVRSSSGTMPGSDGYTGQHADAATGLDYYHARYYDPVAGQFASADTVQDGLNRYAYVGGNPETATDPTGHMRDCQQFGDCTAPTPPPSTGGCTSENCGGTGCSTTCGTPPPPTGGGKGSGGGSGGGGGGSGGGEGAGCDLYSSLCQRITGTFHNSDTQHVLEFLLNSAIGRTLLGFLLAVGAVLGDAFISWSTPAGSDGYTTFGGLIQLSQALDKLVKQGVYDLAAATLVHEAVESYYAIEWGLRTPASQGMDYTADWFKGLFESQVNSTLGTPLYTDFGSYGQDYETWAQTHYTFEPPGQAPVFMTPGFAYTPGPFGWEVAPHAVGFHPISQLDSFGVIWQLIYANGD